MLTPIADAPWTEITLQVVLLALVLAAARAFTALVLASRGLSTPSRGDAPAPALAPAPEPSEPATIVAPLPEATPAPAARTLQPPPIPTASPPPVAPLPPLTPPRARPSPATACEIRWWRGYVKSTFYAVVGAGTDAEWVVAASPAFRWRRHERPPDEPVAAAALEALLTKLQEQGWHVIGRGDEWFSLRLRAPGADGA